MIVMTHFVCMLILALLLITQTLSFKNTFSGYCSHCRSHFVCR